MTRRMLLGLMGVGSVLVGAPAAWSRALPLERLPLTPPLRLDHTSSLALGMRDCFILANQTTTKQAIPNLATPRYQAAHSTTTPTWRMTQWGLRGLYCTGGVNYLSVPDHDGTMATAQCAVHVLFQLVSLPAGTWTLFDGGLSGTMIEMMLVLNASGNIVYYAMGSTVGSSWSNALGLTTGRVYSLVIQRQPGNNTWAYLGGVAVSPAATTETGTGNSTGPWSLGKSVSGSDAHPDIIFLSVQAWNRALTLKEILRLAAHPFAFLLSSSGEAVVQAPAIKRPVRSGIF